MDGICTDCTGGGAVCGGSADALPQLGQTLAGSSIFEPQFAQNIEHTLLRLQTCRKRNISPSMGKKQCEFSFSLLPRLSLLFALALQSSECVLVLISP